ncbi:MAG TPA: hypothetical protein VGG37_05005 [Opitutaceae bacterium]|jgi:hypothetical protein
MNRSCAWIPFLAAAAGASGAPPPATALVPLGQDVSRAPIVHMAPFSVEGEKSVKTHVLFMGADIAINLDKDLYGVEDVWGSNWVVDIGGRKREISSRKAPVNLKITPSLKLTESMATIVGFTRVKAYSFSNDPSVLLTRGLTRSASLSNDLNSIARDAQARVDTMQSYNMSGASVFAGADDQFSASAQMDTAMYVGATTHPGGLGYRGAPLPSPLAPTTSTDTTGAQAKLAVHDPGLTPSAYLNIANNENAAAGAAGAAANGNEPAGKIASGGLDALDVQFDIRSSKPLHNPYVVTMTRFRAPGSRPGVVQNLVYAKSINPIDEHLSHVKFSEEGFPFDYELVDFQLHLYNQGVEVATNVAQDRVELTREEAFEYVKMEYVGSHPKGTLPATPAMAKFPADLPALLAAGKYLSPFYVKVSSEGYSGAAYSDPACTRRIADAYLDSVVGRIRFKPALQNGKPVAGTAKVSLHELAL